MWSELVNRSLWNFEPTVILGTALLMLGYALAVGPFRHKIPGSEPVTSLQQTAFYLGCICMLLALVGPLDVLGDETLFSAHMAQHMILSFLAPPLWIVGTPGWLMKHILPSRVLALIRNPWIAFIVFNGTMWIWHLPALYDDALSTEWLHIGEHVLFMAAGVIGFLPILTFDMQNATSSLHKLFYLGAAMLSCTALAALITLASIQLYSFYGSASLKWGLTPLEDQQLGGLVMWLPGDMLYMLFTAWIFKTLLDETNHVEGQQVQYE